jgi:protein associated with RNAse G/E
VITVHKRDHLGQVKLSYMGEVVERAAGRVVLAAPFERGPMELGYVTLVPGDRFVEYFYADRWYNVFAIFDAAGTAFKGWYCNITRPAELSETELWADDLALDLFVQPDGSQRVLDETEFAGLGLAPAEQTRARAALAELQALAARRAGPFAQSELDRFRRPA